MRLLSLDLLRSPGIDHRLHLEDLDPGFNVVFGPNASGKSSLCRGLAALLWETPEFRGAVEGQWVVDGVPRRCQRLEGAAPSWEPEGEPPPRVPERVHRSAFSFSVDDFRTGADQGDTDALRGHLRRVLAAGFDLVRAREQLLARRPSTRRLREAVGALDQARQEESRVRTEHQALLAQVRELEQLEREREGAVAAREELPHCEAAVRLAEARLRLIEAEAQRAGFPEGLELLHGDEGARLQKLAADIEEHETACREAEARAAELRGKLDGLALDHDLPPEGLTELRSLLAEVRAEESALGELAEQESVCRARLEAVNAAVHPLAGDADAADWQALDRVLRELPGEEASLAARRDQLEALGPLQDIQVPEARTLERGITALGLWLEGDGEPGTSPAPRSSTARTLLLLAVVALVMTAGLGVAARPGLAALAAVVAAVLVGLALVTLRRPAGAPAERAGQRERAAREYDQLGLEGPTSWASEPVASRLVQLIEEERGLAARRDEQRRRAELVVAVERLEQEVGARLEQLSALAASLGMEGDGGRLGLADAVQLLVRRTEARAELADLLGRREAAEARRRAELARATEVLERHGQAPAADVRQLEARIEALQGLGGARDSGLAELREATASARNAAGQLERCRAEEAELVEAAGFGGLDEESRRERLERLGDWKALDTELVRLRADVDLLEAQLQGRLELLDLGGEEARARLERLRERAGRQDALSDRIAEIREQVRLAERGHDLEEAMAAHEQRRLDLAEHREEVMQAGAVGFLLDEVQQEQAEVQRGGLLDEVDALFARFTGDRYSLQANAFGAEDDLPFQIRENDHQVRRFEELSSGTRAQLDLALRLAVARDLEGGGESLPFVIDEALTTSDEERFRSAVGALGELVRDGRQVLFFTSDSADAERFAQAVVEHGLEAPACFDLRDLRAGARRAEVLEHQPLPAVPSPQAGEGFASYAERLGVPRIDPFAEVEELHFAYLCWDSVDAIHELALERVETVGQARAHLRRSERAWRPERRHRFEALVTAARGWLEGYRVGRALPVPPEVLLEALKGGKYGEPVAEFVAEHGGRAERLFEELERPSAERDPRLKGFRSKKADALREFLLGRGYLSEDAPSSAEDRRRRAQLAVVSQLEAEDAVVTAEDIAQLAHALEQWVLGAGGAGGAS